MSWEDKKVPIFAEGICPKVNLIARLEFEHAYYDVAVARFNHYATGIPQLKSCSIFVLIQSVYCMKAYEKVNDVPTVTVWLW